MNNTENEAGAQTGREIKTAAPEAEQPNIKPAEKVFPSSAGTLF